MTNTPLTPLGVYLREVRTARGMTQRAMAEGLGVTPTYLSALERGRRGKPSWPFLQRLTGWLGLIWDDAERLQGIAELSDPKVAIDTRDLSAEATRLACLLSQRLPELGEADIRKLLAMLQAHDDPQPKSEAAALDQ